MTTTTIEKAQPPKNPKRATFQLNIVPRYNGAWLAVRKSRMDDEAIMAATGVDPLTLRFMREVWADMAAKSIPASNSWTADEARYDQEQEP